MAQLAVEIACELDTALVERRVAQLAVEIEAQLAVEIACELDHLHLAAQISRDLDHLHLVDQLGERDLGR